MNFYIKDFGAVADGKTLNTAAIQSAIDACTKAGGGSVVVSGGVYITGTIILKENVDLHIEADGTLLGSPHCEDYPEFPKSHVINDNLPRHRGTCMIYAERCSNISITGKGKIDGHGDAFVECIPPERVISIPYRRIQAPTPPRVVFFAGCRNVLIKDVTMVNQPAGWSYWIHDCDYVHFDRVKILTDLDYPNNDGIHINCSRNVTVSNAIISCGDDAIVVRANSRSLAEPKVCEKVTVTNCTLTSYSCGIRIGWVNDGIIRNCTFSNLVITETTLGISALLPPKRCASTGDYGCEDTLIENLSFSNIVMDSIYLYPIYFHVADDPETRCRAIQNLQFDNLHATSLLPPFLMGRKQSPIESFRFTDCDFRISDVRSPVRKPNYGSVMVKECDPSAIIFSHVKDLMMENTVISSQPLFKEDLK